MNKTFKIFYSWQSDLPGKDTRNFIRECIDEAINYAEKIETIEAQRDEATKDTTGSPDIVSTLFSKIDDCDLFVADLSLCYKQNVDEKSKKMSPNPNVLLELGYAVKTLSWERVICLCNNDYGTEYPFDVEHNRILNYCLNDKDKKAVRREVSKVIFSNIQALQKQPVRAKAGIAAHLVGTYDFNQKKVVSNLSPIEINASESYVLHNEELLTDANRLLSDIKHLSLRLKETSNEENCNIKEVGPEISQPIFEPKSLVHAMAESYKLSETPVLWKDIGEDKIRIGKFLNEDIQDDFFYLGNLKRRISLHLADIDGDQLLGTKEEKDKYNKLQELSYNLAQLELRNGYLNTFSGLKFIPVAIQNISSVSDENIRIVIYVKTGEIIARIRTSCAWNMRAVRGYSAQMTSRA